MQFQNLQVDWHSLPKAASAELKPIEKDYLKVLYISWSITYAIILAAVVTLVLVVEDIDQDIVLPLAIGLVLLAAIITFVIGVNSFRRRAYAIREKDIVLRAGWIFQRLHIVPFNRIQHCVVQSGPIARKYGLATVAIYTAAMHVNDIAIRGLKKEDAEALKDFILQQIQPLT